MNLDFLIPLLGSISQIQTVEHATDLDFIGNSTDKMKTPAVFFHPWSEKSLGVESLDMDDAQIEVSFGLKIVARNNELDQIRSEVKKALLGHLEIGFTAPVEYNSGQVIDVQKSLIWWRDIYTLKSYINT